MQSSSTLSSTTTSEEELDVMALLTSRLARIEYRITGNSTPLESLRKTGNLWRRLLTVANKIGESATLFGDGPLLHQLGT